MARNFKLLEKESNITDFYTFYLSSEKEKQIFLIVFDKDSKIIIYLCEVTKLYGAYNTFFHISSIYKLDKLSSLEVFSLCNSENILSYDVIQPYIYKKNTKTVKSKKKLIVRININNKEDEFLDVKFDNMSQHYLSDITKKVLEKEAEIILKPEKLLLNEKLYLTASILPFKATLGEKFQEFFVHDLEKFIKSKNKRFYNKVVFNIYLLFLKIYVKLESLQKFDFIHGDLKLNNIVIDMHTTKLKDIEIYFIDLGNSYFKHENKEIYSEIFDISIGRTLSKKRHIIDLSFLILNTYIHISHFFYKKFSEVVQVFEKIMKEEFISHLYNHKYILSKEDMIEYQKQDEYSFYINEEYIYRKSHENTKKCFDMKFSINEKCYDIMLDKIVSLNSKLNVKF